MGPLYLVVDVAIFVSSITGAVLSLSCTRRFATPISFLTMICFLATLLPTRAASADVTGVSGPDNTGGASTLSNPNPPAGTPDALASVNLSTGAATSAFPFDLPTARGDAQPSLALAYNSSAGIGVAGVGWTLSLPSIVRKGHTGMPTFVDQFGPPAAPFVESDEYYIDGNLLVPICILDAQAGCSGELSGETIPQTLGGASDAGFAYFRREVDDGARYFFNPNGQQWFVQTKTGHLLTLGTPVVLEQTTGTGVSSVGTEMATLANGKQAVYRWNLVQDTDSYSNTVYYTWSTNASLLPSGSTPSGLLYLQDIYDTSSPGIAVVTSAAAHHVHLSWQVSLGAAQGTNLNDPIWRSVPFAHLSMVDVTSQSFGGAPTRQLVRRYHLAYSLNSTATREYLSSIALEGSCNSYAEASSTGLLPATTGCPTLPVSEFTYTADGSTATGAPQVVDTQLNNPFSYPAVQPPTLTSSGLTPYALVDVDGDGAAELISGPIFGTTNGGVPAAPTYVASQSLGAAVRPLVQPLSFQAGNAEELGPAAPRLVYGDWLATGQLSWLWLNPAGDPYVEPSGNNVFPPPLFEAFIPQPTVTPQTVQGCFLRTTVIPGGLCEEVGGCHARLAVDVDGDGLPDMIQVPHGVVDSTYATYQGDDGTIRPFVEPLTDVPVAASTITSAASFSSDAVRTMADMDGDGLADIVIAYYDLSHQLHFATFINRGDGRFGDNGGAQGVGASELTAGVAMGSPSLAHTIFRMGDLNGDGLADYVGLNAAGLFICIRNGVPLTAATWQCITPAIQGATNLFGPGTPDNIDPGTSGLAIGDVDGSGIQRILLFARSVLNGNGITGGYAVLNPQLLAIAPGTSSTLGSAPGHTRGGLLSAIVGPTGLETDLTYQSVRTLPNVQGTIPVAAWSVTSATTTNHVTGSQARTITKTYGYQHPQYDARDHQFVGFQRVTETIATETGAPGSIRTTSFTTQGCPSAAVPNCLLGTVDYGSVRQYRGVVGAVEISDASGSPLALTWNEFTPQVRYAAMNGQHVYALPVYQEHVFGPTAVPAQFAVGPSATVPPGGFHHIHRHDVNNFGNETATTELFTANIDRPIRVEEDWSLPPGDPTGWNYRLTATRTGYTTTPSGTALDPIGERSFSYNYYASGKVKQVFGTLSGTLPLTNRTPQGAAPQPVDASTPGLVCLAGCSVFNETLGIQYDAYGNVVEAPSPNNRCTATVYDSLYHQLPVTMIQYLYGCGSAGPLSSTVTYDRGAETVTQRGAPSLDSVLPRNWIMKYDAFGRVTEVDQPDAMIGGMTATSAALKVQYVDTITDSLGTHIAPVRQVAFQTVDGPEGGPVYQSHLRYVDGFNDTVAALDMVNPSPGTTQWLVSGVHRRYGNGLLAQAWQGYFAASPILSAQANGIPAATTVSRGVSYDALGRVTSETDFFGNPTTFTYQNGLDAPFDLLVTVRDPEQQPPQNIPAGQTVPGHQTASTQIGFDGHGRPTWQLSPEGEVDTTYLATGEPSTITQGGYNRWMSYDSLGRLVFNAEPNTSTNFSASADSAFAEPPTSPSGVNGWTYSYNDSGDLVGFSDARGCGENIYHDGLGRKVAEDYVGCTAQHAPYSTPNLSTGDGTEAFSTYDGYGQLHTESDRAQTATYTYDARGRVSQIQRQMANPGAAFNATLATRYTSQSYTKNYLQYSQANRLLVTTTGADAPDLVTNGSSVTANYTLQGSLQSVTSSYGNGGGVLLASQTVDAAGAVTGQTFGDAAKTQRILGRDSNERVVGNVLQRAVAQWATYTQANPSSVPNSPDTFQGVLVSAATAYDLVGNPTAITQSATATTASNKMALPPVDANWPLGVTPVMSRTLSYGDDYRLREVGATYNGDESQADPYATDPAGLYPPPLVGIHSPNATRRVLQQVYTYDARGNVTTSTDDWPRGGVPFNRSLGAVVAGPGPDQFASSSAGFVTAQYDAAGNMVLITAGNGATTQTTYTYFWDEVGQLDQGERTDNGVVSLVESFVYDVSGRRVITSQSNFVSPNSAMSVHVFDSLVLEHTAFTAGNYEHDDSTEHVYLNVGGQTFGHAFYAENSVPSASSGRVHIFMPMGDALGSSSYIIDHDTGELVEAATYQAYGAVESDYRPTRWASFREDVRYTGHWDDAQIGLIYFGARYYSPQLGRFISPDPLTIHGLSGDSNPYEYALGSPMRYVDPLGLDNENPGDVTCLFGFCFGTGSGGEEALEAVPAGGEEAPAPVGAEVVTAAMAFRRHGSRLRRLREGRITRTERSTRSACLPPLKAPSVSTTFR